MYPFFAGANSNHLIDGGDEHLSIADLACFGCIDDGVDRVLNSRVWHYEVDLEFGQEVHRVFAALIDFGMALLVTAPFDLSQRHSFESETIQGTFDFFQPKRLNNGLYLFHESSFAFSQSNVQPGKQQSSSKYLAH